MFNFQLGYNLSRISSVTLDIVQTGDESPDNQRFV